MVIKNIIKCSLPKHIIKYFLLFWKEQKSIEKESLNSDRTNQNEFLIVERFIKQSCMQRDFAVRAPVNPTGIQN